MSGKRYSRAHTVRSYECDQTQKMTLPMLINILLEMSGEQSHSLGRGEEHMVERGLGWIILQYVMDIKRLPRLSETITVETQAVQYNKIFTYRDFTVYNEEGEPLVTIHSTFAVIDLKKRKMARITEELIEPYEAPFEKRLVRAPKPFSVERERAVSAPYRVRYFDIDINRHVNNAKYLDWALDTLGQEFLTSHDLTYVNIKFEKEVFYGEMIESIHSLHEQEDGTVISAHQIVTGSAVNCTAQFNWRRHRRGMKRW